MIRIFDEFASILESIGFTESMPFDNSDIKPWRKLPDRDNCVWEFTHQGKQHRWHVKRFPGSRGKHKAALTEYAGIELLRQYEIPTVNPVAWGKLPGGRQFIITEDLAGHSPADKWIEGGNSFSHILNSTADLTAKLHECGLHHRDLYLCHFMVADEKKDIRLIDTARVKRLPGRLFQRRWIVKDLAQFWYSTLSLAIDDADRLKWLTRYCRSRSIDYVAPLHKSILQKAAQISRHDENLKIKQPGRNISIPGKT